MLTAMFLLHGDPETWPVLSSTICRMTSDSRTSYSGFWTVAEEIIFGQLDEVQYE